MLIETLVKCPKCNGKVEKWDDRSHSCEGCGVNHINEYEGFCENCGSWLTFAFGFDDEESKVWVEFREVVPDWSSDIEPGFLEAYIKDMEGELKERKKQLADAVISDMERQMNEDEERI